MKNVIKREERYNIKDKLKMLSLRTKERRLKMNQCTYARENSIVNKELADTQQNIYNTIK